MAPSESPQGRPSGPTGPDDGHRQISRLLQELDASHERNRRLSQTLTAARDELVRLKGELDRIAQPPNTHAVLLGAVGDDKADVVQNGRRLRVAVGPQIDVAELQPGQQVLLSEALVIIEALGIERTGEIATVKELLPGGRALVTGRSDDEAVVWLAGPLREEALRPGDALTYDGRAGYAYEKIPKSEVESLVLEEVPDIRYADIGGLGPQIEQIEDAVELPFLHPDLFREHGLKAPKGILLYGPPGCGKTLIAKAVANSLARRVAERQGADAVAAKSYFLNIKGPELLNKYVGETERSIRLIFARAREKASQGTPVVVFFDEMESLFRTRGTGVSSDVETTIVPQLLSEIDGVETLDNVIVIGASNREDMIDPAILRPGRLDVKVKIERPDAEAALDIFAKYLTPDLPLHPDDLAAHDGDREATVDAMVQATVEKMYAASEENEFIEVTYVGGDKEILYFRDFASGAMIQNVVDRAKKEAIKELLATGTKGLRIDHLFRAVSEEFREHEDLPNTTNPDDWAKISGKKGEKIVYLRTIMHSKNGPEPGRTIDTVGNTGQYL